MQPTKPIYAPQLEQQAAALPNSTHVGHGLMYDDSGPTLWCVGLNDVCASVLTAYQTYTAVFPAPSVAPGANAGTGATVNLLSGSDDLLLAAQVTAGANPAAGEALKVTFGTPRSVAPMVVQVGALNVAAGTLYAANITTTGFSIMTQAVPVAGRVYTLWGHIVG